MDALTRVQAEKCNLFKEQNQNASKTKDIRGEGSMRNALCWKISGADS